MIPDLTQLLQSLHVDADWIGLRAMREVSTRRSVRRQHPTHNGTRLNMGIMVEVVVDGQLGYGATNSFDRDDVQRAADQAQLQAIAARQWGLHACTTSARPPVVGHYRSPCAKPLDVLTAGDVNDILLRLCRHLTVSSQVVQAIATAVTREIDIWLVSSSGSDVHQTLSVVEGHLSATAEDGAIIQQRSDHGYLAHSYQGGWECFLTDDLWARSQHIGEQAVELLTAEECPTAKTTLVLAPDQMMLQLHESVGHPLELDRILGDERNYAGGSFVKPQDFGRLAYGSPLMNVVFDPTIDGELASYQFDDIGAPAQRQYLIRAGTLERGLGSLESQERLRVGGVACARATSWNRPPIDRMANLNLEPGSTPLPELIAQIDDGIYMETNRSWSIDDQRYKFQFGCEYAKRIEQGQITRTLRNPNYRATTPEFWHSLRLVGDRSTWQHYGTPLCGKGEPNQLIWVGHGSPVCAFEQVDVFGGGAA
ncbi:MAG: TldD/PmbA family protein [Synechococcales cyanobacterium K44_A2020_017]|nr:TldD/PmbA family protein [Synechococcales cyanobacterium K32_A2020_035]MBF2093254.1 TldD/PmbA family protein [Synechococcales cyanobacterium K44_A2020_017]